MELSIAQIYLLLNCKKGKLFRIKKDNLARAIIFDLLLNNFISMKSKVIYKEKEITEEYIYYKPILDYIGSKNGLPLLKCKSEIADLSEGGFLTDLLEYFRRDFLQNKLMKKDGDLVYTPEVVFDAVIKQLEEIVNKEYPSEREMVILTINSLTLKTNLSIQKQDLLYRHLKYHQNYYPFLLNGNKNYTIALIPLITFIPMLLRVLNNSNQIYTYVLIGAFISIIATIVAVIFFETRNIWNKK